MDTRSVIVSAEDRAKAAGLSIDALCERAGVHRATWQRWKAGRSSPTLDNIDAIERALGAALIQPTEAAASIAS